MKALIIAFFLFSSVSAFADHPPGLVDSIRRNDLITSMIRAFEASQSQACELDEDSASIQTGEANELDRFSIVYSCDRRDQGGDSHTLTLSGRVNYSTQLPKEVNYVWLENFEITRAE